MAQLRQNYDEIVARGADVLVVGPEKPSKFRDYWAKHDLPFRGLSDPDLRVLERYGQEFRLLKLGRMPAQVIVDREGLIRWAHYGDSMSDIPGNEEILGILDGLNTA